MHSAAALKTKNYDDKLAAAARPVLLSALQFRTSGEESQNWSPKEDMHTVRSVVIWSTCFSVFQTFRGSLTAVSTPIFASKASVFSVCRALQFLLCTSPEFCDFSIPLHRFLLKTAKPKKKKVDQITEDLRVSGEHLQASACSWLCSWMCSWLCRWLCRRLCRRLCRWLCRWLCSLSAVEPISRPDSQRADLGSDDHNPGRIRDAGVVPAILRELRRL